MKEISSKRKKVDADIEEMAKIEFCGSLYMAKEGPVIPGMMVEAAVRGGAKKTREGKDASKLPFLPQRTSQSFTKVRKTWKAFGKMKSFGTKRS